MNPRDNGNRLKAAAQAGDIDLLYTVIQDDPSILERIDLIPFVETLVHIAASMGYLPFATEIMNLKPSFAWKLNPQGSSLIHLAMQKNQKLMVYRFVNINKDLVKVKGRECFTLLHHASQIGEVDLLAKFLFSCPESIEYLTIRDETALHIAVKYEQYDALKVLVSWLKKINKRRGAQRLENGILNKRDDAGNTILHISALRSGLQALQLLVETNINLNSMNLESKTALDIASTQEIKSILEVADSPTLAHKLKSSKTRIRGNMSTYLRIRANMTEEKRNTWLIVATLVATAIYQSGLSPLVMTMVLT